MLILRLPSVTRTRHLKSSAVGCFLLRLGFWAAAEGWDGLVNVANGGPRAAALSHHYLHCFIERNIEPLSFVRSKSLFSSVKNLSGSTRIAALPLQG